MTASGSAGSSTVDWGEAVRTLAAGGDMADVCAAGQLGDRARARLTSRWGGAWTNLVDGMDQASVLVIDECPGSAAMSLAASAASLGFADLDPARRAFRLGLVAGGQAQVTVGTEEDLLDRPGGWDVIVLDGTLRRPGASKRAAVFRLVALAGALRDGGRMVVLSDNPISPLRAVDRLRGRPTGVAAGSRHTVERLLQLAGLAVAQRFGLLRSSTAPVVAFDLDAPQSTDAILAAAAVRVSAERGMALRALRRLAAHGHAGFLVPAWLVVASAAGRSWAPPADRPTGRIGLDDSEEAQVVRGEPPVQLEKWYSVAEAAQREVMALEALERAGVGSVPRLVGPPGPSRVRQTWLGGAPLVPARMRGDQLERWVGEAAGVLGSVHRATRRDDGKVLVHGDFWLGNLLVDGTSVSGIVDWTDAGWGEPETDLDHLVTSLTSSSAVRPEQVAGLALLARRAHEVAFGTVTGGRAEGS